MFFKLLYAIKLKSASCDVECFDRKVVNNGTCDGTTLGTELPKRQQKLSQWKAIIIALSVDFAAATFSILQSYTNSFCGALFARVQLMGRLFPVLAVVSLGCYVQSIRRRPAVLFRARRRRRSRPCPWGCKEVGRDRHNRNKGCPRECD